MSQFDFSGQRSLGIPRVEIRPLMRGVYMWMALGLLTTAAVAGFTYNTPALLEFASNPIVFFGAIIGELVLVIALSWGIRRMTPTVAGLMFFVYAAVNGFTLSLIFLVYDLGAIGAAFLTTAGLFGAMTIVGLVTQVDLTKYSTYFMMAVIGLVIAMVVNIFLRSTMFDMLISIAGVIIFTALTAYDTQKIKNMASDPTIDAGSDLAMKLSILGALTLYLDFINLFLFLLRLFGGRRD
jgi:hypothetical protein